MTRIAKNAEPRYLALIGDLVQSRHLEGRAEIQRRLVKRLGVLSERLDRRLVAPLAVTGGDEFEGLFKAAADAAPVLDELAALLRPVRVTFGLGLGTLSTAVPRARARRRVAELDGPAFHAAREALAEARRRNAWLAVRGLGEVEDQVLSSLGELLGNIRESWTDKQAQYVAAARGAAQKEVARHFSVSPSVVSESLKAARFEVLLHAEEAFSRGLAHFAGNTEPGPSSVRSTNR